MIRRAVAAVVEWRAQRTEVEALRRLRAELRLHPFDEVRHDAARMGP